MRSLTRSLLSVASAFRKYRYLPVPETPATPRFPAMAAPTPYRSSQRPGMTQTAALCRVSPSPASIARRAAVTKQRPEVTLLPGRAEPEKWAALCTVSNIHSLRPGLYSITGKGESVSPQQLSAMYLARCPCGLEQIVAAALAAHAMDTQRAPVQPLSMTATPGVVEAIGCCDQETQINN
jgi:hypothetical protein